MDVLEVLKRRKEVIDKKILEFFNSYIEESKNVSERLEEYLEWIKDFNVRGGKRLRPSFFITGYQCVGGKDMESIMEACLSIEAMEGYLLIHDDIMDRDELRRGKITLHKAFEKMYREKFGEEEAEHFGISLAILGGDITNIIGKEILLKSNFPVDKKIEALKIYINADKTTNMGQMLDIITEKLPLKDVKEEDILTIFKLKTSKYTIEAPLQMGAVLGGGTEKDLKILSDYAIPLGQAFQIQDDILGMFGDEKKIGKPVYSDLKEGKRTLLIIYAYQNGNPEQKKKILASLGNPNVTEEKLEEIRKIVIETGSLDYSKKLAKELASRVKPIIEKSNFTKEGKEYLIGIADFLINREL